MRVDGRTAAYVVLVVLVVIPLAGTAIALDPVLGSLLVAGLLVIAAVGVARSPGDGTVWNSIPGSQYAGRFAESGGLARGEQERALEEIQRRAELADDPDEEG